MKIKKVLVVDNNITIVDLVKRALLKDGYEVATAHDGIDALDRLEESEILPDVIILDLVMPKIDGQRLTRILKTDARYEGIPIVILSGIAAEEDGKLLAFGADAYIAKGKIDETFGHIRETLKWLEERDTTEEKRELVLGVEKLFPREMTRELLLVKQHFDSMFQLMHEGVIEIDQDHRVLFANPAAQRLLCQEDHLLFGKPVEDLFQDGGKLQDYLEKMHTTTEEKYESVQLTCRDYVTRAIATPFFLEKKYVGAIIILQDITSLVHREKSLETLMEAIVRHAPVGLCLLDGQGRILVSNEALTRIFRQPPEWISEGVNMLEFLADMSPPLTDAIKRGLELPPGKSLVHKADFFAAGEQDRQVINLSATALDVAGEEKVLLLVEAVTEKTLLEESLRRANEEMEKANRSKSVFLSMVSHELRTPLSVVRGYISLILEGKIGPDPQIVTDALRVADKRARHLQHLIEELLDLSRIEAGKLSIREENLDLKKHTLETLEMFLEDRKEKELTIEAEIPDNLPQILGDHDKIHQVLTNLISNAIKFSHDGGTIVLRAFDKGDFVELQIKDSGIGIPADRIDQIFEKFYQVDSSDTRKHAGTGLGLSIVKMIISALGGTIHVTSEVGSGTTFIITLPVGMKTPAKDPAPPTRQPVTPEQKKKPERTVILVVEDDPDTQEMIRLFLDEDEYNVTVANDAFEGLKEFFRHKPAIVLADALLPLMSGLDLCRIIKTHPDSKDLPVIMLSAAAQEDEIRSGYEVGADAYLVKPFTSRDLLDNIHKFTSG